MWCSIERKYSWQKGKCVSIYLACIFSFFPSSTDHAWMQFVVVSQSSLLQLQLALLMWYNRHIHFLQHSNIIHSYQSMYSGKSHHTVLANTMCPLLVFIKSYPSTSWCLFWLVWSTHGVRELLVLSKCSELTCFVIFNSCISIKFEVFLIFLHCTLNQYLATSYSTTCLPVM